MKDFNTYKNFAIGTFFSVATIIMISFFYIVYTQWQGYWSEGFGDFRSISTAIVDLKETAKPISVMAPEVLVEMQKMNVKISLMQESVNSMDISVGGIHRSVYDMSYTVPNQMGKMQRKINMWNMMSPFR